MFQSPNVLTSPKYLVERRSTVIAINPELEHLAGLDNEELICQANFEAPNQPIAVVLANRLENSLERISELQHELHVYESDADDARGSFQALLEENQLFREVLIACDIDPDRVHSKRYRQAMEVFLPSDKDPCQLELNFGGDR